MRELHEQKCPARARPVLACFVLVLDPCSSYKAICSLVLVLAGRVSRCSRAILVARRPLGEVDHLLRQYSKWQLRLHIKKWDCSELLYFHCSIFFWYEYSFSFSPTIADDSLRTSIVLWDKATAILLHWDISCIPCMVYHLGQVVICCVSS